MRSEARLTFVAVGRDKRLNVNLRDPCIVGNPDARFRGGVEGYGNTVFEGTLALG